MLPPVSDRGIAEETSWYLDHFSRGELSRVLRYGAGRAVTDVVVAASLSFLVALALSGWSVSRITNLTAEPGTLVTLGVVFAGFAVTAFIFHALRLRSALRLRDGSVAPDVIRTHLAVVAEVSGERRRSAAEPA
jgi:hypothetical protein